MIIIRQQASHMVEDSIQNNDNNARQQIVTTSQSQNDLLSQSTGNEYLAIK